MSLVGITTQAGFVDLQNVLSQVANNLNSHVNLPLGKAHGVQLQNGYIDSGGNDLRTYQNSNGIVIANQFAVFYVNGVTYYAPANTTSLAGQPVTTGELNPSGAEESAISLPGGSTLVTDYTAVDVASGTNVNNLLLAHSRLPFQTAHGQVLAFLQNTYDSSGATIGRYVVQFVYGGVQYSIPCDTRLGGPPQPPRGYTVPVTLAATDDDAFNVSNTPITCVPGAGLQPVSFYWQWSSVTTPPVWNTIPAAVGGVFHPPGWVDIFYDWPGGQVLGGATNPNTLFIRNANPGSTTTRSILFQCVVTNTAGSSASNTCTYTQTST